MGSGGDGEDDRTFRVNFSAEGFSKLRQRVMDKLKEFMGDYTDDTLVEYVIVLLKNGRRKEEARSELNVFLGDDSDSFVAWLWDHLGSNIHLYVTQKDPDHGGGTKTKPASEVQAAKKVQHVDSDAGKVTLDKSRARHQRDWKGLVMDEHPVLRSTLADNTRTDQEVHPQVGRIKRSLSPRPELQRKRSRLEERPKKREGIPQPAIFATRRLLQFAVRDAVATSRPSNSTLEPSPSLKRLRSVVSTSVEDSSSLQERPQRLRSVARVPNAMATAIKAVAEAAKDVTKVRSSVNVFDRLGHATDAIDAPVHLQEPRQAVMVYDEAECGVSARSRGALDASRTVENIVENPLSEMDQDRPTFAPVVPHKAPMNVNTWKSPQYLETRQASEMENRIPIKSGEGLDNKSDILLTEESTKPIAVSNGNVNPYADTQDSEKMASINQGLVSTGPPTEDAADSRTIFVNNVHFAATKDSLSRHFNKFGEVIKVVILADAATGQPKGSAYIEFMKKESAENALSLDGTSFMSRILKVVRKSSATPEATSVAVWPRVARGGPFAISRFGRVPFPRGVPSLYRSRVPMRPGARSMQWKRDAQPISTDNSGLTPPSSNAVPSSIPRSMTYVRTEPKANGNSSAA